MVSIFVVIEKLEERMLGLVIVPGKYIVKCLVDSSLDESLVYS